MDSIAHLFRHLFEYERDTHEKILRALNACSESARASEPFQKVVDLMAHVTAARLVWLWRLGRVPTRPDAVLRKGVSLRELELELRRMQEGWTDYLSGLNDSEVQRVLEYTTLDGRPFTNRIEQILIQLHGHAMYHEGQVAMLLRQAGAEPPATDYVLWARERS